MIEARPELASALPRIYGNESEIREALTNLVFNAVDALPGGGTIVLRTREEGEGPVVPEVSDTERESSLIAAKEHQESKRE